MAKVRCDNLEFGGYPPVGEHGGRRHALGFTIIELLVVISIIALLAAISIGAYSQLKTTARLHEIKLNLQKLETIEEEITVINKGKKVPDLIGRESEFGYLSYDWSVAKLENHPSGASSTSLIDDAGGEIFASIERFVWAAKQHEDTELMLGSLQDNAYGDFDGNGFLEVRSTFHKRSQDNPKIIYAANVSHDDSYTADDFLPERRRPYFAAPGLDGDWGTDDDLYSFDIDEK